MTIRGIHLPMFVTLKWQLIKVFCELLHLFVHVMFCSSEYRTDQINSFTFPVKTNNKPKVEKCLKFILPKHIFFVTIYSGREILEISLLSFPPVYIFQKWFLLKLKVDKLLTFRKCEGQAIFLKIYISYNILKRVFYNQSQKITICY